MGRQDIWTLRPIKITDRCICTSTINCKHNEWVVECPYCKDEAHAAYIYGPYFCSSCGEDFQCAIDYWTEDLRK